MTRTIEIRVVEPGFVVCTHADWAAFDDRRIASMDGADASRFWAAHKEALLSLAAKDGRGTSGEASP